jgi:predicted dehydrogenase
MIFHWLGELPVRVSAVGRDYVQPGIPDVAFLDVTFASGVIAHVEVSWLSPSKLRNTTIVGSRKMLVYDDTENLEKVKLFDKGVNYKDPETFGEYQLSYRAGDIVSPKLDSFEPLGAEMEDFLRCIEEGGRPRADAMSGLQVVRVLEEAEKSLAAHGEPRELSWEGSLLPRDVTV